MTVNMLPVPVWPRASVAVRATLVAPVGVRTAPIHSPWLKAVVLVGWIWTGMKPESLRFGIWKKTAGSGLEPIQSSGAPSNPWKEIAPIDLASVV